MRLVDYRGRPRVVITGLGLACPAGIGCDAAWANLSAGKSGISKIERFDASKHACQIAGLVPDFLLDDYFTKKQQRTSSRFMQLALIAAREALTQAGIALKQTEDGAGSDIDRTRVGVCVGSGIGGLSDLFVASQNLIEHGPRRVPIFTVPCTIENMASGAISIEHDFYGPSYAVVSACTTGNHSIGHALRTIQAGDADVMVTGGAEATVDSLGMASFQVLRALSLRNDEPERASRPFDRGRDGFVMAEASGVLIVESLEHAIGRGANILTEIIGYGANSDSHHITAPLEDGKSAANCMRIALADGQLEASKIDYLNAHGTSTPLGDLSENRAIKQVFGENAYKLAVSSTKSMTGHALGGAGGIESIFCVLMMQNNLMLPTINLEDKEEEFDLDYVPAVAREKDLTYTMTNSFGFGGTNATLIFRRFSA